MKQSTRIWIKQQHLLDAAWLLLMFLHTANSAWAKAEACPPDDPLRPLLNSERIQSCFGSYGVDILEQQGSLRISSLYSQEGDKHITRTLAVSEFATDLPENLQATYQAIRAGASMGASLEAAGWRVEKRHRYFGEIPVSETFRCMSGLPENHPQEVLAVQVYDLYVLRDDQELRFALLAELHDPRYLTLQDLQQIYADLVSELHNTDEASSAMLQRVAQACALP